MDRIDIHIGVPAVKYKELASDKNGESSNAMRERVKRARALQHRRFKTCKHLFCNVRMESKDIRQDGKIDEQGHGLLRMAITKLGLSARTYDGILKVSRTIADIEGVDQICPEFVSEAIQYRSLDRMIRPQSV